MCVLAGKFAKFQSAEWMAAPNRMLTSFLSPAPIRPCGRRTNRRVHRAKVLQGSFGATEREAEKERLVAPYLAGAIH